MGTVGAKIANWGTIFGIIQRTVGDQLLKDNFRDNFGDNLGDNLGDKLEDNFRDIFFLPCTTGATVGGQSLSHLQQSSSEHEDPESKTSRSNSAAVVLGPGLGSSAG